MKGKGACDNLCESFIHKFWFCLFNFIKVNHPALSGRISAQIPDIQQPDSCTDPGWISSKILLDIQHSADRKSLSGAPLHPQTITNDTTLLPRLTVHAPLCRILKIWAFRNDEKVTHFTVQAPINRYWCMHCYAGGPLMRCKYVYSKFV